MVLGFYVFFSKGFSVTCPTLFVFLSHASLFNPPVVGFCLSLHHTSFYFSSLEISSPPSWSFKRHLTSVVIWIVAHISKA